MRQLKHTRWPWIGALLALLASGPALAEDLQLQSVQVSPGADEESAEVVLTLDKSAEGSAVSAFRMSSPDRLVVDIVDATASVSTSQLASQSGGLITKVEVKPVDDPVTGRITRVLFYLTAPVDHQLLTEGNQIRVRMLRSRAETDELADLPDAADQFEEEDPFLAGSGDGADEATQQFLAENPGSSFSTTGPSASVSSGTPPVDASERPLSGPQALPATVTLSSLDLKANNDQLHTVLIGVKGTTAYRDTRPRPDTLYIDIPGATVPDSLTRSLDASRFLSPVRMVRAYKTSSGARVTIVMRADSEYTITQGEGGMLTVSFPVPESLREERQSAMDAGSSVSPAGPDGGQDSAYRQETLIGSSGRQVDPNQVWGNGSGSPSSLNLANGFMYDSSSATDAPYTGRQISLDFVNADIHSIFRLISHVSRLNIVAGDDVKGTVTVRMENVPWDQALAAILQSKGLASQRFGNIIRVAPIETIKAEQQAAVETKRAVEELEELQLLVLPLNYSTASDVSGQLKDMLSERGTLQVDTQGNQLIIKDAAANLAQIRALVQQLDKQTPQVLIEARVVEANSSFTQGLGIEWGATLDASTATGYSTGLFFPNSVRAQGALDAEGGDAVFFGEGTTPLLVDLGPDAANSGIAFSLGSIPGLIDLDARLSALESEGYGKVVSSPRVTTLDNQQATIEQGARIPYLSTSSGGTQVQFIQASLTLEVTPHITSDDKVFLSVSVANNRPDFSLAVQGQPAILVKEVKTEVLVADGDTTVLGGVFATEQSFNQSRVPGLHKIPLIGLLFKNSNESLDRTELLVFITPHIVGRTVVAAEEE